MQYADSKFDGQQYVDFKPLLNPKENITCLYADTYSVVNTVLSMCQVAQITSHNTMSIFSLIFILYTRRLGHRVDLCPQGPTTGK